MNAELLAPAGDWECVRAAVANGADAVYFGLPRFNARLRAHNFTEAELPEVVAFCHRHGVKAYVVMNTLVFTDELEDAAAEVKLCARAGVDALIVQDVGLVRLARALAPGLGIHASTQMTVTSPEGVEFAKRHGVERVVLARELSLRELEKFEGGAVPLEVFVHGALCVAYSGQCLTSESLGQRSANRGECAQACRMPYELVVDGALRDLGDKRYLLSPQDLAAVNELPALLERGVVSFKIEGRLKTPEYVAAVCQVYRRALDAALAARPAEASAEDRYALEMTFSRGLSTGWLHGVDHQQLVGARFGKKRGPFAGRVRRVGPEFVEVESEVRLQPGDGIVFDTGEDTENEQGGRIYEVRGRRLFFERGRIDFGRVREGDRVWKTDDPALEKKLRQSFGGRILPWHRVPLDVVVSGRAGEALVVSANGRVVASQVMLQEARTAPLTTARLREHLGKLAETVWELRGLENLVEGEVILPIGELNRVRRALVFELEQRAPIEVREVSWREVLEDGEERMRGVFGEGSERRVSVKEEFVGSGKDQALRADGMDLRGGPRSHFPAEPRLSVLCRTDEQLEAALAGGVETIYLDFEDIRRYRESVARVRAFSESSGKTVRPSVFLATPRIQKAGEEGFFKLIVNAAPDGVLIRNLGAIDFFWEQAGLKMIGDFSLNVANPLTAQEFMAYELERCTVSYDLNLEQIEALLREAPPEWFELTLHQHMPMFHMEHCVFAAFMSKGSSYLDCGRPCEKHRVHLRDRVGMEHPLRADVGCRNTLFNATAQSGAQFYGRLFEAGLRAFRVELLEESREEAARLIAAYQGLLRGDESGEGLWRVLKASSQLGVTRGTL